MKITSCQTEIRIRQGPAVARTVDVVGDHLRKLRQFGDSIVLNFQAWETIAGFEAARPLISAAREFAAGSGLPARE